MKLKQAMFLKTFESAADIVETIEKIGVWPDLYVATSAVMGEMTRMGVIDTIHMSGSLIQTFLGKPIVVLDVAL